MRRVIPFVFVIAVLLGAKPVFAEDPVYAPLGAEISETPAPGANPAQTIVPEPPSPVSVVPDVQATEDIASQKMSLLDAVAKGKELLAPILADFKNKESKVKPLTSKTGQTAAALAIWDKKADTVTVVGGTRGAKYFTPDNGSKPIPIVTSAGSQTAYRDEDPDSVVVGTVQASMVQATVKKKKVYKPSFSYYVPYNSELYSVEALAAGSDYLSNLIQEAFDELKEKKIESRAFPGLQLVDVIDPYLIKTIAVIEHADGEIYKNDNSEAALGRFLIKLALNREDALDSALSVAGARGMVQFIPSTYKLMVTKRPDLELIPDFVKGMADHNNSIKAEAAYLDMILADMPQAVRDIYVANRGAAAEYIAAGYNGGSARVKKAIQNWGEQWSVSHASEYSALTKKAASLKTRIAQIDKKLKGTVTAAQKKSLTAERAKAVSDRNTALGRAAKIKNTWIVAETAGYVVKTRRVYNMLAAGFFATPNAPANTLPSTVAVASTDAAASVSGMVAMNTAPAATNP